jgi:hypothetical protein
MSMKNNVQIELTRQKLLLLEKTVEEVKRDPTGTAHTRELTLRSLKGLINQLKKEIARFLNEAAAKTRTLTKPTLRPGDSSFRHADATESRCKECVLEAVVGLTAS